MPPHATCVILILRGTTAVVDVSSRGGTFSPARLRLNATRAGTLTCSETCTPACLSSLASPRTPAWPYSFPPHAHAVPSPSSATACHPPRLTVLNFFSNSTRRGVGIHSSSVSKPSVSCEFQPHAYVAPERARAAELRLPATSGLSRGVATAATDSPEGRRRAVGVGTCQSGVARFAVTGAEGRPSWPSSPQPHCDLGRRDGEGATNEGE